MDPFGGAAMQFTKLIQRQVRDLHKICRRKCVARYDIEALSKSEENCIDRCVFKYNEANEMLSKVMQEEYQKVPK
ncbi:hypothetical protein SteCoe_6665 [Stentor coeruleus]|uniref:Mitochondrial import inner membrane translocase subunit n=1 Tax=Stentor coeruleus TaxID=5963 RepID=A0A1R2CPJ6_9CILI|nr:hypothetical protein SteCoe_6665 [Stentor coeruleus]